MRINTQITQVIGRASQGRPSPAAIRRLAYYGLIPGVIFALLSGVLALRTGTWPYVLVSFVSLVTVLAALATLILQRTGREHRSPWPTFAAMLIALPALSFGISGIGVFLAVIGALILPRAVLPALRKEVRQRVLYLAVGSGVVALLIDLFEPAGRLALPISSDLLLIINVLLIGLAVIRIGQDFSSYSLRSKLLLAFLAVSVLPLAALTYLSNESTHSVLREEANSKLLSSASQTAQSLDQFMASRTSDIEVQAQFPTFHNYLAMAPSERTGSNLEEEALDLLLATAQSAESDVTSIALLDPHGRNLLDSADANEGQQEAGTPYFDGALRSEGVFVSHVLVFPDEEPAIYISRAIRSEDGDLLGVLRVRYPLDVIQSRVVESATQAGEGSFAVVFDDQYYIHLAHSTAPETIMKAAGPLEASVESTLIANHRLPDLPSDQLTTNLPELVENLNQIDEDPFFEATDVATGNRINQVAVVRAETRPWLVAFFQPQDVLFAPAQAQARRTLILSLLIVNGVAVVALAMATLMARPITRLTETAREIAEGNLDAEVEVETEDELGMLAGTFNVMTRRMRALVTGLEARVSDRTEDLQRRAHQLQAAADVAKDAASLQQVDKLVNEVVNRVEEQFGYYHAGVFLLDDSGDEAVLRAASSQGGQRMLARGHKLAVGKVGLVGYVTGTGNPRIALDVGDDAVHFANPDLPDTRSEVALPLIAGGHVIGALDVQSREANAFDEQDVIALQTMADQLAIAIQNARLLEQQTELAADRRRAIEVYRQLTQSMSYDQVLADSTRLIRSSFGYDRVTLGLTEGADVVIRSASAGTQGRLPRLGQSIPVGQGLLGRAVSTESPVRLDDSTADLGPRVDPLLGELEASLSVPLISRGEAIGALAVERVTDRVFSENDIELLELLASQAAVSIENARLFEETQRRLRQVDALYRRQTSEAWELLVNARRVQGEENRAAYGEEDFEPSGDAGPIETSISLRGEVIGKLDVMPQRPDEWSEEELEILQDVAEEVAGQLEQLRLVEEIQRRATQLETAAEIARVATGLLEIDPLLNQAVNLIRDRFGFYHVAVYLVEGEGDTVFIREASGDIGEALKQTRRRFDVGSRTVIGFATGSGEYYVAHDTETDPFYRPSDLLPKSGSELAVPLKIGDRVIGALDVHDEGRYAFSEDDIVVIETLADQIAVAVENARLFQEALSRAEREQSVVKITSRIRASQDIDSILRTAVEEMRGALGARRATIRLAPVPAEIRDNSGQAGAEGSIQTDAEDGRSNGSPSESDI